MKLLKEKFGNIFNMLIVLLTAIVFFYIGKYSQTTKEVEVLRKVKRKLEKHPKPGVLPFKTQQDFDDEKSGDKALEDRWKASGFAKEIMK